MAEDLLTALQQQAQALTREETLQLVHALLAHVQATPPSQGAPTPLSPDASQARLAWLKAHHDSHGGQYVALDGTTLVAVGPTYRTAWEGAYAAGQPQAFITSLPQPDEVAEWGGYGRQPHA